MSVSEEISMHIRSWMTAALIALAACGGSPQAAQSPQPTEASQAAPGAGAPAPAGEAAGAPFTAEQIRDATLVGRTYRFALRQGEQDVQVTVRFTKVTPDQASMERTIVDAAGKILEQATEDTTWQQIVGHAAYPADATEITDATVEVPAGTFDAMLYTVSGEQEGKPVVSRMYFAKALPGAPVKTEIMVGDQVVFSMVLVEHVAGQEAGPPIGQ
jgi:hypothetical protein